MTNNKIGTLSSVIHFLSAFGFILCLIIGKSYGNYFFGMILALSFVTLTSAFTIDTDETFKVASNIAMIFASVYAVIILLVYYANITTVLSDSLDQQASQLLSTQNFGLFFNYDLLGYAIMSLSVFFTGVTIDSKRKTNRILKKFLLFHGLFFLSFFIPILGIFNNNTSQSNMIGPIIQSIWCLYFSIIDVLAFIFFRKRKSF